VVHIIQKNMLGMLVSQGYTTKVYLFSGSKLAHTGKQHCLTLGMAEKLAPVV
jgi:hypothetical protein